MTQLPCCAESADAGASLTYPQQAGTIRKNAFIVSSPPPTCSCTVMLMHPCLSCCWIRALPVLTPVCCPLAGHQEPPLQ